MKTIFDRIAAAMGTDNCAEIGRQLGFGKHTVYKWRDEKSMPTTETVLKVYELTGSSLHWLLTGHGEQFPKETEQSKRFQRVSLDDLLPVHGHLFSALSVVAEIGQELKLTAKKETVMVPTSIISEISVVLRVTDNYFAAEGIQAGQLLVVEPVNGSDVTGSVVVAIFNNKPIIRRFERSGNLACFHSLGSLPLFELPFNQVRILYEVKSITTPINK